MSRKPRLGVFKLASCDGCQLSLLDCEDELLAVADALEIAYFNEATRKPLEGEFDLTLVEGSMSAPEHLEQIQDIRSRSRFLVAIGACATAGGIQALRNGQNISEYLAAVYAKPEYIHTLNDSTPVSQHITVDFELRGCPINKYQLLEVITAFLAGRRPNIPHYSVCVECKHNGTTCLAVARKEPCLGPITQSGCGAICPSFNRGCYGCYGPVRDANVPALISHYDSLGVSHDTLGRLLQTFNTGATEFQVGLTVLSRSRG
jgi:sulfhydrogenase subunit delta